MGRSKALVGGALVAILALQAGVAFAKPLSPKAWKKQGNAICKATNRDLDAVYNDVFAEVPEGSEPTDEQIQAIADQIVPIIDDAVTSIVDLDAPKKLQKNIAGFEEAVQDALAAIEADPAGAFSEDADPFAEADKYARKLGLKACA